MNTKLMPIEPTHAIIQAMSESRARDDEGEFPAMFDLLDFSGENKTRTVLIAAYSAAIKAAPDTPPEGMMNGFVPVGWGIFDGNGKLSSFTHGKEGADAIASEYSDGDYYVDRLYA